MKIKYLLKVSLYIILSFFLSCTGTKKKETKVQKKKSKPNKEVYYLHLHRGKAIGILRVECKDCKFTYTINNKDSIINVLNGNEDRFLYPKRKSYIDTHLQSNENQMIRILIIDPNGNIVSNILDTFKRGQTTNNKYLITYKTKKTL